MSTSLRSREGAPGGAGRFVTAVATATPWTLAIPIYAASGATYGYTLRQLAHHGYLPFPEPE